MARVAFIGLGHMGGGMAPNLAKAGHEVRAFDLSEEALAHAVEHGFKRGKSAAAARKGADAMGHHPHTRHAGPQILGGHESRPGPWRTGRPPRGDAIRLKRARIHMIPPDEFAVEAWYKRG